MLKIEFSEIDVNALDYERYHHPHPRVQRKMEVVYLKRQGCRIKRLAASVGLWAIHYGVT
jgi:hypothetical protein